MNYSVIHEGAVWDVVVSKAPWTALKPAWLVRWDEQKKEHKMLLCQVQNNGRFGWTVVVHGEKVHGPRLVNGFKQRWQAIEYAVRIRFKEGT